MTPETVQTDRDKFRARMKDIIDSSGSIYALAKRAGTAPNTIRRYLTNSEPTRPMLIAIAKASGVSLEWLATGRGPKTPNDNHTPCPTQYIPETKGFRERLKFIASQNGDVCDFCSRIKIPEPDLAAILAGRHITMAELAKLGSTSSVPIRWLLSGGA
jgi:transcriptional regulator with XRE-family HTH domain